MKHYETITSMGGGALQNNIYPITDILIGHVTINHKSFLGTDHFQAHSETPMNHGTFDLVW
jgi:hypothetical protein